MHSPNGAVWKTVKGIFQQGPWSAMLGFISRLRAITVFSPKQTRIWQAFVWKVKKRKPSGHVSPAMIHRMSSGPWSPYRPRPHQSSHHTLCHLVHEAHTGLAWHQLLPTRDSGRQLTVEIQCPLSLNLTYGFRRAPATPTPKDIDTCQMVSFRISEATLQHQRWPNGPWDTLHSPSEWKESYSRQQGMVGHASSPTQL